MVDALIAATEVERPELIDHAIRMLTGGEHDADGVPRFLTGADAAREIAKLHGMSERNARRVVARARELIAKEFAADLPSRSTALVAMQLGVLSEARRDRDWPSCNGAIRNLCTIYGVGGKVQIQPGGGLGALIDAIRATPGERDAEIARLEAKEREGADVAERPA